jgi:hypothetical protein
LREGLRQILGMVHQGILQRSQKRKARLQGSLYIGWHNASLFPTHIWKVHKEKPPHTGHRVHGGPCRKMCGGHVDELGEIPHQ